MSESLVNYKIGHEKRLLFIGKELVNGVQSVTINQDFAAEPVNYAGIGVDTVRYIPRGEQTTSVNINSYLINKDYFFNLVTGNNLQNIYLTKDKTDPTSYYSLLSGCFNSFEASYSVGAAAETNAGFTCVGDAGKIPTGNMNSAQVSDLVFITTGDAGLSGVLIPDIGSISVNFDTFQTNRLLSYSIKVDANKKPVYNFGSKFPKRVELLYPINVECNFTFEPGDYQDRRMRNFPESGVVKNLEVVVKDYKTYETICSYNLRNLALVSEGNESKVGGNVGINQTYRAQIWG